MTRSRNDDEKSRSRDIFARTIPPSEGCYIGQVAEPQGAGEFTAQIRYTDAMRAHQANSRAIRRFSLLRPRGVASNKESKEEPETPAPIPPISAGQRVDEDRVDTVVDLLNLQPSTIVDTERLRRSLAFGFAGGDTAESLTRALHSASVEETEWDSSCFADGLYIVDLLDTCMKVRIEGFEPRVDHIFLTRLLTHPPKDHAIVGFRQDILGELANSTTVRTNFQQTYRALYRLRDLFESEIETFDLDNSQRRLETLGAIRDAVEHMASGFDDCDSGLKRLHRFATRAKATAGYQRLVELLDYDNHLAGVDLSLRVGADGRIKRFEIQSVRENQKNSFYQSPMGRWLTRFALLFRGYFLGEGELVNRWVDSVFDGVVDLLPPVFQTIGEMEFYLSALSFKDLAETKELSVCFAEMTENDEVEPSSWSFTELFNPLLFAQKITPVPCDLGSEHWETITVVTGPNSGGKTRLLQAIAIAQMLSQCGMYTPAKKAKLNWAAGLFVSLIQEARADQREGRLGTELIRIRQMFELARPGYLIVLDELCSGTNPSEGEEIFRLVISLLCELRPCVFITTHFLQFAAQLQSEDLDEAALEFLQVELDDHECPTFRFVDGVAETSLAHLTAARLGVTREELLALVRRNCGDPR